MASDTDLPALIARVREAVARIESADDDDAFDALSHSLGLCRRAAPLLAAALEEQIAEVERLKAFAEHVAYAPQPVSMSAADCCADYERRARAALEGKP